MDLLRSIGTGFYRSIKAWKAVLSAWFISFVMVLILVLPLKSVLKSALGSSTITERLSGGIDSDVFNDLLNNLSVSPSFFFSGLLFLALISIIISAFISGGLFFSVSREQGKSSLSESYASSSRNFWSYLGISLIISVLIIFAFIFIIALPVGFAANSVNAPDKSAFIAAFISGGVFLIAVSLLLVVADYSRSWLVINTKKSLSGALGFGFSCTFRSFFSSLTVMLLMMLLQAIYTFSVLWFVGLWRPPTSGGTFVLLLITQVLFTGKLFIKTARYGAMTTLMESVSVSGEADSQILVTAQAEQQITINQPL